MERCDVRNATVSAILVIPGTLAISSKVGAAGLVDILFSPRRGTERIPHGPAGVLLGHCRIAARLHCHSTSRLSPRKPAPERY